MHPWGLSGPEFLWLYTAGLVVGLVVAFGVRVAARRPRLSEPPHRPAPEELGFLAGGPRHAVQVAIARLVDNGLVRVDRRGTLSSMADGGPTGHPLDDAVLAELTRPRKVAAVATKLAGEPVVTEIGESLARRGLLVRPGRAVRTRRLAPIPLYLLFVIGVARWINGTVNDLPTGYLAFLLAPTLVASVYLSSRMTSALKARTVHGDRVVAEVKASGQADPLERVAVSGLSAYPDAEFSRALADGAAVAFIGGAWSYASAGSFDSFVSTGSSGGSTYTHNYASSSGESSSSGGGCGGGSS
ncbi:TIGR04222 domain-containing membrane protein [Actinomadura rugatobispora]|uniref:TIGR04222 domain-containing membrane protein n=1 Tax=Actinomadura rugatobispora TaxID=1994 RepID=A0ABW0ZRI5_9ACTN|nr:TIGR04222 domain-containing membrane protein [Actinomadura rugatobispora]